MKIRALIAGIAGALFSSSPAPTLAVEPAWGQVEATEIVVPGDADEPDVKSRRQISSWEAIALSAYAEELTAGLGPEGAEPLAGILGSLSAFDRSWLLLCWAASDHAPLRLAVGRTAPYLTGTVGLASALDVLASDPNPEVRDWARRALAYQHTAA